MSITTSTKSIITQVLRMILVGENDLENLRQMLLEAVLEQSVNLKLCFYYVFDLTIHFYKISRDSEQITLKDLCDLLDYHVIKYQKCEVESLLLRLAVKSINYQKFIIDKQIFSFLVLVLPFNMQALKQINSLSLYIPQSVENHLKDAPPPEIITLMIKIFSQELILNRMVHAQIEQVKERWDSLERSKLMNFLCTKTKIEGGQTDYFYTLLDNLGLDINVEDTICLLRKLDKDNDGDVGIKDWTEFFSPLKIQQPKVQRKTQSRKQLVKKTSKIKPLLKEFQDPNPQKVKIKSQNKNSLIEPVKNNFFFDPKPLQNKKIPQGQKLEKSNDRYRSFQDRFITEKENNDVRNTTMVSNQLRFQMPQQTLNDISSFDSLCPTLHSKKSQDSSTSVMLRLKGQLDKCSINKSFRYNYFQRPAQTNENLVSLFFEFLSQVSEQMENHEQLKNELSLRADFTIQQAFLFFDQSLDGEVDLLDFENTYYSLVEDQKDNIQPVFNFLQMKGNSLKYSDFHRLFMPKTISYAQGLSNRSLKSQENYSVFSNQTFKLIIDTIQQILISQSKIQASKNNVLQQSLTYFQLIKVPHSLSNIFQELDTDQDGIVFVEDLYSLYSLYKKNISINIPLTFQRIDNRNQGSWRLCEFQQNIQSI